MKRLRGIITRPAVFVAEVVVGVAASIYTRRANLLDVAGAFCGVMFAASFGARWAWGFAAVYLLVRAGQLEAKS